jgi:hypothetical protein
MANAVKFNVTRPVHRVSIRLSPHRRPAMRMLLLALLSVAIPARAQQSSPPPSPSAAPDTQAAQKNDEVIVLSGVATTAHIADPNERIVFSGRVMRVADFVAAVSASSEAVQHLRTQEKQNREKAQPVPPLKPSN